MNDPAIGMEKGSSEAPLSTDEFQKLVLEKFDAMDKRFQEMEKTQRDATYQLDRLNGDMLSLRNIGGTSAYLPARQNVPQGTSLQENVDNYIPPNPFY